jgi:hypothetical protein
MKRFGLDIDLELLEFKHGFGLMTANIRGQVQIAYSNVEYVIGELWNDKARMKRSLREK